jgi:hypothetical protein
MTLTDEQFGPVEAECFHVDQYFSALWGGNRTAFDFENLRSTCFVDYGGFHGGHPRSFVFIPMAGYAVNFTVTTLVLTFGYSDGNFSTFVGLPLSPKTVFVSAHSPQIRIRRN